MALLLKGTTHVHSFVDDPQQHAVASGDPPIASNSGDTYIGYFENMFGEQWIFAFDRQTKTASLHGGDVGWNTHMEVVDGSVSALVLQDDEAAWLRACWNAAVGGRT